MKKEEVTVHPLPFHPKSSGTELDKRTKKKKKVMEFVRSKKQEKEELLRGTKSLEHVKHSFSYYHLVCVLNRKGKFSSSMKQVFFD